MTKKLLWLSDSPFVGTGYATMTYNILNGLSDNGFECHSIMHNTPGQDILPGTKLKDGTEFKFTMHGCGREKYSRDKVLQLLKELKPNLFGVLLDTFMLKEAKFVGLNLSPAKTFFYYPTDGEPHLPLSAEEVFTSGTFQYPIAMAKRGQQQVKEAHNIDAHYIPHAVHPDRFKPLTGDKKLKNIEKWSQRFGIDLSNKKIIGLVARNQGRKMLDRMIPIMHLIRQKVPNAVCLMHTDPFDSASYFNMIDYISKYNLENKFIFTGLNFLNPFSYEEVTELYNLMDVFLLTTTGEGFGVPIIEAMGCEVPVVATNFTTTQELVIDNDAGFGIDVSDYIMGSWNVMRAVCSIPDAAEKVSLILNDEKLQKRLGKNGRKAVLKEYTWDIVIKEWVRYLNKILKEGY